MPHYGLTIDSDGNYTRLYRIYTGMKTRCYNANYDGYPLYGGKGIKVCAAWLEDFAAFKSWAESNGYDDTLTLDRIDGTKDYSPDNCRWATRLEQTRNRSTTWKVTIDGVTKTAAEWCEESGISLDTAKQRKRTGWEDAKAVTAPLLRRRTR